MKVLRSNHQFPKPGHGYRVIGDKPLNIFNPLTQPAKGRRFNELAEILRRVECGLRPRCARVNRKLPTVTLHPPIPAGAGENRDFSV